MKKIVVVGTGYVGLVTGVSLAEVGHDVTCIDVDEQKIAMLQAGISPIYEPGLSILLMKNIEEKRLSFTTSYHEAFVDVDVIYIAVGTPQKEDGTVDLCFIEAVVEGIVEYLSDYAVIVTKSTVPVGTNDYIRSYIKAHTKVSFDIVSNPEFLREGSAVHDTFHGDRIVIGADSPTAFALLEEVNRPFGIPIFQTDICSAELTKYASNAFLAMKISFINEIAELCEKLNADVEDVAQGMGLDKRIGQKFLKAGIGYGGSCFPKDTSGLLQMARRVRHRFTLLETVIEVNHKQQRLLVEKAKNYFGSLQGKVIALLGTAFKPNTDDMREAPSIVIAKELLSAGADVVAYDPIAMNHAKKVFPKEVRFSHSAISALSGADAAMIATEWDEMKSISPAAFKAHLKEPIVFDGRNCFNLKEMHAEGIAYYAVGRPGPDDLLHEQ